ncbi:putative ferric-chelate reductase 1 isoform X2 [Puntigrus tetrazona]|uniref:putative ferric-chelate reductase 1 isoform X2 n=1 Tax=Puntigrus tetrazona TaxID=1606681 RepID=UPI001C89AAFC|nr:putative ferric-chelate reductase 1 isoform X2 [Puntigrus tetrazona]
MNIQFVILVFGLNLSAVAAFSHGVVTLACTTRTPNHGGNIASVLQPPYSVTTDVSNYTEGQVITVTLQANQTEFRGFLLQARNEMGPVGTFTVAGSNAQLLSCEGQDSSVSHNSNVNKSTIVVQWKAPYTNNRDIHFRATVVQTFSVFWVGIESDPIRFVGNSSPSVSLTAHLLLLPLLAIHFIRTT